MVAVVRLFVASTPMESRFAFQHDFKCGSSCWLQCDMGRRSHCSNDGKTTLVRAVVGAVIDRVGNLGAARSQRFLSLDFV